MEGFSKIAYKGKEIFCIDYSSFGFNKEKALQLLRGATEYYVSNQLPPNSVLALVNVSGLHFDNDVINAFKEEKEKTDPYDKKIAILGMKGLQKVAYNFIISLTKRDSVKLFDIEQEAKEWLVS
jgi:hypothetical protein